MQRILLTGGSGLVGRHTKDLAQKRGFEVNAPSSYELDLLDYSSVLRHFERYSPSLVIHAAGRVGGIMANIREPVRYLVENWDMGRNVVLAARTVGVEKLLNLGSSCMYPRGHTGRLREEDILSGRLEPTNEGYAIAKCSVARLCSFVASENPMLHYKTLIPCNLYGPYDSFDEKRSHLIASIITKLHKAKVRGLDKVVIWGDGTAKREFMYAGDLASAALFFSERIKDIPDVLNVGVGSDLSVYEYYKLSADVIGYGGDFAFDLEKPTGMQRKLLSIERQLALGWSASTALRQGLQQTYEFYLASGAEQCATH